MSDRRVSDRPLVSPQFFKAHGHGNDYLVFEEGGDLRLDPDRVARICDRWRGPGADGIVVLGAATPSEFFSVRMFNPDGSEFERSGNGLRIAALFLFEEGRVGHEAFRVSQAGATIALAVGRREGPEGRVVEAAMGPASFPVGPPFLAPGFTPERGVLTLEAGLEVVPVSMGNPHAVVFGNGWSKDEVDALGAKLAVHPAFPMGTNVQFADAPEDGAVRIQIWERGVGRTSSSGTSACAVAAAAVKHELLPLGDVTIRMDGGDFRVGVPSLDALTLEGPVQSVYRGRLVSDVPDGV